MVTGQIDTCITEALISSVITTDNTCSMPCGAVYCSKSGKTGEEIKRQYIEQIKILQMCQACQQRCRSDSHIITSDQIQLCDSTCQNCIDLRSVCDPCQDLGHISHIPQSMHVNFAWKMSNNAHVE